MILVGLLILFISIIVGVMIFVNREEKKVKSSDKSYVVAIESETYKEIYGLIKRVKELEKKNNKIRTK